MPFVAMSASMSGSQLTLSEARVIDEENVSPKASASLVQHFHCFLPVKTRVIGVDQLRKITYWAPATEK